MSDKLLSIGETAETIGVSIDTLRRWDRNGNLKSFRPSPKSNRYYRKGDIDLFLNGMRSSNQTDIIQSAKEWAMSKTPPALPSSRYCKTSDVFNGRLDTFGRELSLLPSYKDVFPLVVAVAGEIGNNSYNHNLGNWPDAPGTFFGYDVRAGFVVLADRGQGVYKTLKRVWPELKNEREALQTAFTKYISGRAPENRGNGLKFVRDVVIGNPLSLEFYSGSARIKLNHENSKVKAGISDMPIPGCLAILFYTGD